MNKVVIGALAGGLMLLGGCKSSEETVTTTDETIATPTDMATDTGMGTSTDTMTPVASDEAMDTASGAM